MSKSVYLGASIDVIHRDYNHYKNCSKLLDDGNAQYIFWFSHDIGVLVNKAVYSLHILSKPVVLKSQLVTIVQGRLERQIKMLSPKKCYEFLPRSSILPVCWVFTHYVPCLFGPAYQSPPVVIWKWKKMLLTISCDKWEDWAGLKGIHFQPVVVTWNQSKPWIGV